MTTPAAGDPAPAAVVVDGQPAAPAVADPAPAPAAADSLIPGEPAAVPDKPAEPAGGLPKQEPKSLVDDGPEWLLYDGVKGAGKMPEWYKADKYKTVADQAEAYVHLEKRLGAFVGAPKEGKYETPPMPEGVEGEFLTDHPLFDTFSKWAAENQFSQKAYNEAMGMLALYEASQAPDFEAAKKEIGTDADKRITDVSLWAKANLGPEEFAAFRSAMGDRNAATVFKAVEAVVAKTRQPALPKPGEIPGDAPVSPLAEIDAMQAKRGPDGKRLYEVDAKYRADVERRRVEYFKAQERAA